MFAAVALVTGLLGLVLFSTDHHPDLMQQMAFQYSLITIVAGFSWLTGVRKLMDRDR